MLIFGLINLNLNLSIFRKASYSVPCSAFSDDSVYDSMDYKLINQNLMDYLLMHNMYGLKRFHNF